MFQSIQAFHQRTSREGFLNLLHAFVNVANAVAYAHSKEIVHRDLKPQNVVLGEFGEVILLDWGLAKRIGDKDATGYSSSIDSHKQSIEGDVMGTPAYMPPEQAEGRIQEIDEKSDIYSLGATLYQVLTGRAPFLGKDTNELFHRIRHETPAHPKTLWSQA